MNTLPLFFNLKSKTVLIIGGGQVAKRKAMMMGRYGASIKVITKKIDQDFYDFLMDNHHQVTIKAYDKSDLFNQNIHFIICATDDNLLNKTVYDDAKKANILVNVVDTPDLCDFIFPAIIDRNPIMIGIGSNGNSPVLTRLIRAKIESILPNNLGNVAKMAGDFRQVIKEKINNINHRRQFWELFFDKILNSQLTKSLPEELDNFLNDNQKYQGEVYIVGAGSGDSELLTFKALRLMQQADIVLYDALVSDEVLDLCRRDSQKIFVGKKMSHHSKTQEQIHELIIKYAKKGKRVLRLKGGDPFIFGRGGEEMQECQKHQIPCQIVPGITAALSAASYAGIPLTYRGVATSVRFLTAVFKKGDDFNGLKSNYHTDETLVFYMGLGKLKEVCDNLIDSGLNKNTPIAIISNASLVNQKVLIGDLENIIEKQAKAKLPMPAIIIVGNVVNLYT